MYQAFCWPKESGMASQFFLQDKENCHLEKNISDRTTYSKACKQPREFSVYMKIVVWLQSEELG